MSRIARLVMAMFLVIAPSCLSQENARHAFPGACILRDIGHFNGAMPFADMQTRSGTYRTLAPKVIRDSDGRVTDVDFRDGFSVHTEHNKTTKFFTDPVSGARVRYWTVGSYTVTTPHGSLNIQPQKTIAVFSGADFLRKRVASLGFRILWVSQAQATAPPAAPGGPKPNPLTQLTGDAKEVYEQFKEANEIVNNLQEYVETAQHYNELYQASQRPLGPDDQAAFLDKNFWMKGIDAALKITDFKGKSEWFEDFLSRFVRMGAYMTCQLQGRCVVDASGRITIVDQAPQKSSGPRFPSYEPHGYLCNCGNDQLDTMIVGTGAQAAAESAAFVARCPLGMSNFAAPKCTAF